MDTTRAFADASLKGWRSKVGASTAPFIGRHSPLDEDQARVIIGAAFFALSTWYVINTVRTTLRQR